MEVYVVWIPKESNRKSDFNPAVCTNAEAVLDYIQQAGGANGDERIYIRQTTVVNSSDDIIRRVQVDEDSDEIPF